jgi:hypothetical protein
MVACVASTTGAAEADDPATAAAPVVVAVVAEEELDAPRFLLFFFGIWAKGRHHLIAFRVCRKQNEQGRRTGGCI